MSIRSKVDSLAEALVADLMQMVLRDFQRRLLSMDGANNKVKRSSKPARKPRRAANARAKQSIKKAGTQPSTPPPAVVVTPAPIEPRSIEQLAMAVVEELRVHPGQTMERLQVSCRIPSDRLADVMAHLGMRGEISYESRKGVRTYFATKKHVVAGHASSSSSPVSEFDAHPALQ